MVVFGGKRHAFISVKKEVLGGGITKKKHYCEKLGVGLRREGKWNFEKTKKSGENIKQE